MSTLVTGDSGAMGDGTRKLMVSSFRRRHPVPTKMMGRIGTLHLFLPPLILARSLAFVVTPRLPSGATLITRHQQTSHTSGSTDGDVPDLCGDRGDAAGRWFQINCTLREDDGIMRDCDAVVTCVGVDRDDESTFVRLLRPVESRQSASDAIFRSAGNQVPPRSAVEAIEATQRWSSNFVRRLNLCPWAGQSLDTHGAMRFWVLLVGGDDGEELIFDRLHRTIRMAGEHLVSIAAPASEDDPTGRIAVDPSAAISFVILARVDDNVPDPPTDFGSFYETFLHLEDRLLDECDVYWDTNGDESGGELPLGCDITIAAFHPEWKFGSSDTSAIGESCQPIDYEKRTPYPTVSIVLSSAIDSLMDERVGGADPHGSALVTKRIAEVNAQTLGGLGIEEVEHLYAAEVTKCLPPGS